MKPIMMIQMMFHTTTSRDYDLSIPFSMVRIALETPLFCCREMGMHLTPGAALRRCGYIPAGDEGAIPPSKRTPKMLDDAIDRGLIARGTDFLTSVVQSCTMALPPTSSVATLAVHRATVVQIPTANPIVAALPRVALTTHYRS